MSLLLLRDVFWDQPLSLEMLKDLLPSPVSVPATVPVVAASVAFSVCVRACLCHLVQISVGFLSLLCPLLLLLVLPSLFLARFRVSLHLLRVSARQVTGP